MTKRKYKRGLHLSGSGMFIADPGCLSRILIFTHPGSRIKKKQQQKSAQLRVSRPEAEFLNVIGTKVSRVFPLLFTVSSTPPPPPEPKWFVMQTLYTETSSLRTLKIMPRNFNEIVRSSIRPQGSLYNCSWMGMRAY
jgi:hypothetical protein